MSSDVEEEISELKPCPFCGCEGTYSNLEGQPTQLRTFWCICNDKECGNSGRVFTVEEWNNRPLEDELSERAEKAESIIRGMFPMWIVAMSYCEHGRAASLDRMRNYYNGRDNPLTRDELHYLFSMKGEK